MEYIIKYSAPALVFLYIFLEKNTKFDN